MSRRLDADEEHDGDGGEREGDDVRLGVWRSSIAVKMKSVAVSVLPLISPLTISTASISPIDRAIVSATP